MRSMTRMVHHAGHNHRYTQLPEQRHPTGHHGQINFREVEKKMEGTVTMTLSDYDELKYQIRRHEQKAVDAQLALANLKIFKFEKSYSDTLTLKITNDAEQFLINAFAEFEKEYDLKKNLDDISQWDFATPKSMPAKPEKVEAIF